MVYKIADNIISPLGFTTEDNIQALKSGQSALCLHENAFGLPEPFYGSLLDHNIITDFYTNNHKRAIDKKQEEIFSQLTRFEQYCILSILNCLYVNIIRDNSAKIQLFLSSTKGNVDLLQDNPNDERYYLSESAKRISSFLGLEQSPVVVSNACISGVCAQIAAYRAIESGRCSYAIVVGADLLSRFIISGFQSFKALSSTQCRPFDKDRIGLNLGEAIGTIVLGKDADLIANCLNEQLFGDNLWHIKSTSIHNDANHISGPSRTGEGAYRVLTDLMKVHDREQLAFVNAHGTATLYNDEMESIAIHRAGLAEVPVNGLKGYYGHTLGAAGVIETILSMAAIDNATVLATKGYAECGTTYPLNISTQNRSTNKHSFIKILSGFGGSNAGILWEKGGKHEDA